MGALESRAGQVPGALEETGSTATREGAPAQEAALAWGKRIRQSNSVNPQPSVLVDGG